jgi:hypothetical protein
MSGVGDEEKMFQRQNFFLPHPRFTKKILTPLFKTRRTIFPPIFGIFPPKFISQTRTTNLRFLYLNKTTQPAGGFVSSPRHAVQSSVHVDQNIEFVFVLRRGDIPLNLATA